METAVVTNIQSYSIHDGPGIRTVVFLQGCPLRCRWCSNPETLLDAPGIGFSANLCQRCGRCKEACNFNAFNIDECHIISREHCTKCFACADACFYGAIVRHGEEMTSHALFEKTRRDKMFYDSSQGGVTFSGGEPLLKPKFIAETSAMLLADGISTCIETCGAVPWDAFETLLPLTNHIYFDIKFMDKNKHILFTGTTNERILENARRISASGADVRFRRPLIPNVNDSIEEIEETSRFLSEIGKPQIELMPYHCMGVSKYAALAINYTMDGVPAMSAIASEAIREAYEKKGIKCTISH